MKKIYLTTILLGLFVFSSTTDAVSKDSEQVCVQNAMKDYRQWLVQSKFKQMGKEGKKKFKANVDKAYADLNDLFSLTDYSECPKELELNKQELLFFTIEYNKQNVATEELVHSAENRFKEDSALSLEDKKAIRETYRAAIRSRSLLYSDISIKIRDYEQYLEKLSRNKKTK